MRITDIRCYVIEDEHPLVPFRWRKGLPGSGDGTPIDQRPKSAILRMDTDEGITGATKIADGEAVASLTRRRLKSFDRRRCAADRAPVDQNVGDRPHRGDCIWLIWA